MDTHHRATKGTVETARQARDAQRALKFVGKLSDAREERVTLAVTADDLKATGRASCRGRDRDGGDKSRSEESENLHCK